MKIDAAEIDKIILYLADYDESNGNRATSYDYELRQLLGYDNKPYVEAALAKLEEECKRP